MVFSAADARELADQFLYSAEAIDSYLDKNWDEISRGQYETLNESAKTLFRLSNFMTTEAVGLSIAEMDDDAAQLKQVVSDAKETLAQLQAVGTAIKVVAGLVDLATAIMAKDPGAALKASKNLYDVIREASA